MAQKEARKKLIILKHHVSCVQVSFAVSQCHFLYISYLTILQCFKHRQIVHIFSYDKEFKIQENHIGPLILNGREYCTEQTFESLNLMDMQNVEIFYSDIVYRSNTCKNIFSLLIIYTLIFQLPLINNTVNFIFIYFVRFKTFTGLG